MVSGGGGVAVGTAGEAMDVKLEISAGKMDSGDAATLTKVAVGGTVVDVGTSVGVAVGGISPARAVGVDTSVGTGAFPWQATRVAMAKTARAVGI